MYATELLSPASNLCCTRIWLQWRKCRKNGKCITGFRCWRSGTALTKTQCIIVDLSVLPRQGPGVQYAGQPLQHCWSCNIAEQSGPRLVLPNVPPRTPRRKRVAHLNRQLLRPMHGSTTVYSRIYRLIPEAVQYAAPCRQSGDPSFSNSRQKNVFSARRHRHAAQKGGVSISSCGGARPSCRSSSDCTHDGAPFSHSACSKRHR